MKYLTEYFTNKFYKTIKVLYEFDSITKPFNT